MSKKIITDNIDLANKSGFSKDEFYGKEKINVISNDSAVSSKAYEGENRFFALLSTSDKEINNRMYDYESWKKTVTDGIWQGKPYQKPLLRNHNLEYSSSDGRIVNSFFIDHESLEVTNKDGESIPGDVIEFYKNNDSFINGTGSVIVELTCSSDTAQRIESGLDVTVSQSSFMNDAKCNICGSDYYSGECEHVAGRQYATGDGQDAKNVKCLVVTKDYEPIELSIVNLPANDTSVIYVHDKKKCGKKKKKDSEEPNQDGKITDNNAKFDDSQNEVQNVQDNAEIKTSDEKPLTKTEDAMWKELAKDHFADKLKIKFDGNENVIKKFEDLFETISEDQTKLFKDFMEVITLVEVKDSEVAEVEANAEPEAKKENETEAEDNAEVKENEGEEPVESEEPEAKKEETPETPASTEPEEAEDMKSKALENVFTKDTKHVANKFEDKTLKALVANVKF